MSAPLCELISLTESRWILASALRPTTVLVALVVYQIIRCSTLLDTKRLPRPLSDRVNLSRSSPLSILINRHTRLPALIRLNTCQPLGCGKQHMQTKDLPRIPSRRS